MPLRNPFARRPGAAAASDENARQDRDDADSGSSSPGFERVDTIGSMASSALSIRSGRSQDTGEYKMSVVNDSGVYLPPSPPDEKGLWPRKYLGSRTSTETRSSLGDIEPFSISRESFDSYRRSFDITAKSPVVAHDLPARQSLDSARFPRLPRSAVGDRKVDIDEATAEEGFEDVGLDDHKLQAPAPRKRGFFSKFSEPQDGAAKDSTAGSANASTTTVSRFLMPGRKRGQSQSKDLGSELGTIARPGTSGSVAVEAQAQAQEVH